MAARPSRKSVDAAWHQSIDYVGQMSTTASVLWNRNSTLALHVVQEAGGSKLCPH